MFISFCPPRPFFSEDLSSLTAYASSSRLSADLGRACVDKEGADVYMVARDRSRFLAHKAIISCRSEVLGELLADAAVSEGKSDAIGEVLIRFCRISLTHMPLELDASLMCVGTLISGTPRYQRTCLHMLLSVHTGRARSSH